MGMTEKAPKSSIREHCSSIQAALAERLEVDEDVELAVEAASW